MLESIRWQLARFCMQPDAIAGKASRAFMCSTVGKVLCSVKSQNALRLLSTFQSPNSNQKGELTQGMAILSETCRSLSNGGTCTTALRDTLNESMKWKGARTPKRFAPAETFRCRHKKLGQLGWLGLPSPAQDGDIEATVHVRKSLGIKEDETVKLRRKSQIFDESHPLCNISDSIVSAT